MSLKGWIVTFLSTRPYSSDYEELKHRLRMYVAIPRESEDAIVKAALDELMGEKKIALFQGPNGNCYQIAKG